jgi:hypothetical protein
MNKTDHSMKPPPERERFEYDQEAARQRFAFRDLINKAIKGKPQPLCEHLSSGPSLSHRDWYDLAEFIGRICPRIGRHPGPGDDMHFAIQAAARFILCFMSSVADGLPVSET